MDSQPDGSIRGGANKTSQGGSLPRRSQRSGRKTSLSQRLCVRDQGEPYTAVVNINRMERNGLRQAELCPRNTIMMNTTMMNTNNTLILDRSQPGMTIIAPTVRHRDAGDKYQRSRKLEVGRTLLLEHGM